MREHEVFPPPNPRLLTQVDTADALVYGMGSLYLHLPIPGAQGGSRWHLSSSHDTPCRASYLRFTYASSHTLLCLPMLTRSHKKWPGLSRLAVSILHPTVFPTRHGFALR